MTFITSDFERSVGAPVGAVNAALAEALRGAGFEITSQSLTAVSARRGSRLALATLGAFALRKIPVVATAQLAPAADGCSLAVRLADEWNPLMGQASAVKTRYRDAFAEVQRAIDAALFELCPAVSGGAASEWSNKRSGVFLAKLAESMGRVGDGALSGGAALLTGDWRRATLPWDGVERVRFESAKGSARLTMLDVQAMLDAGTLITTRAGSMPPALMAEVVGVQAHLEQALTGAHGTATVELADPETAALEFLRQQASMRTAFPVRTLQECTGCHTRKLVNVDYQKILKRNQMLKGLGGGIGASISNGSIKPFVLLGRVMNVAKLDPDFVCRSCQGMTANESIVALCPQCGAFQGHPVLKTCGKCKCDLRTLIAAEDFWQSGPADDDEPPLGTPAEWLADPTGRHEYRYWDGHRWTEHVADDGEQSTDQPNEYSFTDDTLEMTR
jgi:hypothetical protein